MLIEITGGSSSNNYIQKKVYKKRAWECLKYFTYTKKVTSNLLYVDIYDHM